MNVRHQQFISEYFNCCMNGTEAYLRVYPKSSYEAARANAARLIAIDSISEEIKARISEKAMSADEVLIRLADQARGNMGDFWNISNEPSIDLVKAKDKMHLVKKLKVKKTTQRIGKITETTHEIDFDLYDAQAALQMLGKHHDLFVDKIEIKVKKELEKALDLLETQLDEDAFKHVLNILSSS